jgi:hypothetical protein
MGERGFARARPGRGLARERCAHSKPLPLYVRRDAASSTFRLARAHNPGKLRRHIAQPHCAGIHPKCFRQVFELRVPKIQVGEYSVAHYPAEIATTTNYDGDYAAAQSRS